MNLTETLAKIESLVTAGAPPNEIKGLIAPLVEQLETIDLRISTLEAEKKELTAKVDEYELALQTRSLPEIDFRDPHGTIASPTIEEILKRREES